ncbi:hypothetical protein CK203_032801 [Vitis vinifera]|uniref:Uncharacterized protein n=1 Tax=Vitis vinifera TaxID=29760 RepID=A0A438I8I0_VITVI|nr:hypothetical protein CK203_032801 [Vitis vinifera]
MSRKKRFNLSAHIPSLQLVTWLPNSNKGRTKGHILVSDPWGGLYEGPDREFHHRRLLGIPSRIRSCNLCPSLVAVGCEPITDYKDRRGQLVEWVEKASFDWFNKLFEISATKPNHQVLLMDKNLQTIVREPKLFILPVLPRLALRLKSTPGPLRAKGEKTTGQDVKANSIHKPPDFQLYRPSSCQEEGSSHLACSKATKSVVRIPFSFCFNFFTSSSSVANIEPSTEVDLSTASTKLEAESSQWCSYSL